MRRAIVFALLLGIAVVGLPTEAHAGSVHEFTINCGITNGFEITTPGAYRLKRGVHDCTAGTLIAISSSLVSVDLDGLTIDGTDNDCHAGIRIVRTQVDIEIKNGTISDCANGINLVGVTDAVVKKMTVKSTLLNAIAADGAELDHVHVKDAGFIGIQNPSSVVDSTVEHTVAEGISTDVEDAQILRNTISHAEGAAISAPSARSTINDNEIRHSSRGIEAWVAQIDHNVISDIADIGIESTLNSHITANHVNGAETGIFATENALIAENTLLDNELVAIGVAEADHLLDGFTILENVVKRTYAGPGIFLGNEVDPPGVQVADNVSNANANQGIAASGTAVPHDSVGRNRAKDNGEEPQCDLNLCA